MEVTVNDPTSSTRTMATSSKKRVLDLLNVIQRSSASLDELAEHFGVSRRTVFRDLDAIRSAGFHVSCIGGRYQSSPPKQPDDESDE